jgi:Mn2+/Fe2+ NRAMP family transporter
MALTVLILPLDIGPLLLFMNAKEYVGEYRNGWISNTAIIIVIGVVFVIALGAIPLELLGG